MGDDALNLEEYSILRATFNTRGGYSYEYVTVSPEAPMSLYVSLVRRSAYRTLIGADAITMQSTYGYVFYNVEDSDMEEIGSSLVGGGWSLVG